jgi:hypothetical protein
MRSYKRKRSRSEWWLSDGKLLFFTLIGLFFLTAFFLSSCSNVAQTIDVEKIYRADIKMEINGRDYYGIAAPPPAAQYKIKLKSAESMDFFVFRTCHREVTKEDVGRRHEYNYVPTKPEEIGCPAEIEGLNDDSRHSFGFIFFHEDLTQLPMMLGKSVKLGETRLTQSLSARLKCNGDQITYQGVSVCQSAVGLVQTVEFGNPVVFLKANNARCAMEMKSPGKSFTFSMRSGLCRYTFARAASLKETHAMYTRGYDEIVLMEN